ncbi:peritrophin-1-like [Tribolium madens]|uniref:peritrophin-1-like n=1 Tax=Tribolium madens TaxID=41895 RepID=UPI001CF73271|nr:peritrophin-1-like [Tribolium madens]
MKNQICILSLVLIALSCAQAQRVAVATPDLGPECPSSGDTFIPYKEDCNKYWECRSGDRRLMSCPEGLWFNMELLACDYPGDFCVPDTHILHSNINKTCVYLSVFVVTIMVQDR